MFVQAKNKKKIAFIFPEAVVLVCALSNSIKIISASGKTRIVDGTLKNCHTWMRSKKQKIFPAHKSFFVNMRYMQEIEDGKIIFYPEILNVLDEDGRELVNKLSISKSGLKFLRANKADLTKPADKKIRSSPV